VREIYVVFEVEALTGEFLAGKTAVVLDVLRATSSMIQALASGAARVVPTMEVVEAVALRDRRPRGTVVLGGERGGLQIPGFDVGNTPQEFSPEVVGGKTVVMTTTNGTRALLMALPAARLYVAALTNAAATARAVAARGAGDIVRVGAGTERRVSWDDTLGAGAVIERLIGGAASTTEGERGAGEYLLTDSAMIALEIWRLAKGDVQAALRRGRGGRNVMKFGLEAAFATCGAVDSIDFAARVKKEPLEIVAEHS
jgi:2-phosphosulfolactate phosphatase